MTLPTYLLYLDAIKMKNVMTPQYSALSKRTCDHIFNLLGNVDGFPPVTKRRVKKLEYKFLSFFIEGMNKHDQAFVITLIISLQIFLLLH